VFDGRLVFAGRCHDGPFGPVVLNATTEQEALGLMRQDPSVRAGLQAAELNTRSGRSCPASTARMSSQADWEIRPIDSGYMQA